MSPDDNVLDVGCGAGWLERLLSERVPDGRVVGMDISDEMVHRARRNYVALENTMFVIGGVDEIPWDANFFTRAISVESAYYWPDPARGLREILRVLREGGSAWVLINYYRDNPHCHQWAAQFATSRTPAERRGVGRIISRRGASRMSRIAAFPIPHPRLNPTTGRWFRDAAQLRAFREAGALLVHWNKAAIGVLNHCGESCFNLPGQTPHSKKSPIWIDSRKCLRGTIMSKSRPDLGTRITYRSFRRCAEFASQDRAATFLGHLQSQTGFSQRKRTAEPRHIPGSAKSYTPVQIDDLFNPPDWFPGEHGPLPSIIEHGIPGAAQACGSCHLMSGLGHPESANLAGLNAIYIMREMADFKIGSEKRCCTNEPDIDRGVRSGAPCRPRMVFGPPAESFG